MNSALSLQVHRSPQLLNHASTHSNFRRKRRRVGRISFNAFSATSWARIPRFFRGPVGQIQCHKASKTTNIEWVLYGILLTAAVRSNIISLPPKNPRYINAPLPCKLSSGRTNCVPPFIEIGGNGKGNKDPKPFLGSKGTSNQLKTHRWITCRCSEGQEAKHQSQSESEICPSGSLGLLSPKRPSVHRRMSFQHDPGETSNLNTQRGTPTVQKKSNKESLSKCLPYRGTDLKPMPFAPMKRFSRARLVDLSMSQIATTFFSYCFRW